MTAPDDRTDDEALAGEYVLGLLTADEAAAVEHRLAGDGALRAAVAGWRDRLRELDDTAPAVAPGPSLWQRIEKAIAVPAAAPPVAARPSLAQRLWDSLGFWRAAGLTAACASVALAVAAGVLAARLQPAPVAIAVLQGDDASAGAIVEAFADGSIRLVPLKDIPVPAGRALQVWTLWDRERGPVPLGLLPAARQAQFGRDGLPAPRAAQLYEITLEPASGSPTGRPTGPVLYKGNATVLH